MKKTEFDQLPLRNKLQWVSFEGEFVMDIRYYEFKINLYQVRDLFVEVFFHHKDNTIAKVLVLDRSCNRMKFYADQVRIENVL